MAMSDGGKGDSPRPFSVPKEVFDSNFDRIFGKKEKQIDEKVVMKNEYFESDEVKE